MTRFVPQSDPLSTPDWPEWQVFDCADPEATTALAARCAAALRAGDVVLLSGDLGTGKTHFARGLIRARIGDTEGTEDIPSPSFTLVQTYETDGPTVFHADLYRLSTPDEVYELGLEEAFEHGVSLIEWPERLAPDWPPQSVMLQFAIADGAETGRQITLRAPEGSDLAQRLVSGGAGVA